MLLTPKRRTRKPNVGAQLNWADPRCRGLRYAFPFNEGGGGYANGSLPNRALPMTATTLPTDGTIGSTTSVTWTPRGNGSLAFASSTTSYVDCGVNDDTTGEITWIVHVKPTGALPSLQTIFGQNKSDGAESIDSVYITSGGNVSWWANNSGATQVEELNGTASSIVTENWYRIAGRRSGAAGAWAYTTWINEKQDDTASGVTRNPAVLASDGNFRVGFAGAYTGAPFVGDYCCFLFWHGVALKDHEILSVSANPWQLFGETRRNFWIGSSGGGTTFDRSFTDTIAVSDVFSRISDANRAISDTAKLSDSFQRISDANRALTDAAALIDIFSRVSDANRSFTDTTSLVDAFAQTITFFRPLTETVKVSDSFARVSDANRALTDTTSLVDSFARVADANRVITDTLAAIDSFARVSDANRILTDMAALIDSFARIDDAKRLFAETTILSDSYTRESDAKRNFIDTLVITDAATLQLISSGVLTIAVVETLRMIDSFSRVSDANRALTDTLSILDVFSRQSDANRSFAETVSLIDAALRVADANRQATETVSTADSFARVADANRALAETLAATDSMLRVADASRSLSDVLAIPEAFQRQVDYKRVLTDVVAVIDAATLLQAATVIATIFSAARRTSILTAQRINRQLPARRGVRVFTADRSVENI